VASLSATLAITPLTDAERADVRRFSGYPMYGPGASGFQGWRFFEAYGVLEYRLTNMAPAEFQVLRLKLSDLYTLESAIPATSDGLDTKQAAVFTRNPAELAERRSLYAFTRRELCAFLGIPPGPGLGTGGRRIVI
jgi:hypothetical protein